MCAPQPIHTSHIEPHTHTRARARRLHSRWFYFSFVFLAFLFEQFIFIRRHCSMNVRADTSHSQSSSSRSNDDGGGSSETREPNGFANERALASKRKLRAFNFAIQIIWIIVNGLLLYARRRQDAKTRLDYFSSIIQSSTCTHGFPFLFRFSRFIIFACGFRKSVSCRHRTMWLLLLLPQSLLGQYFRNFGMTRARVCVCVCGVGGKCEDTNSDEREIVQQPAATAS